MNIFFQKYIKIREKIKILSLRLKNYKYIIIYIEYPEY